MNQISVQGSIPVHRSGWLLAARLLWLAVALSATALLINALITNGVGWWHARLEDCPTCLANYQTWARLGLSVKFWAVYYTLGAALETLPVLIMGILIFWRRPSDPFRIFFSLWLVLFATLGIDGFVATINQNAYPFLVPLLDLLQTLGSILLLLWFCFPDGRFVPRWTRWLAGLWIAIQLLNLFFRGSPLDVFSWPAPIPMAVDTFFILTLVGLLIYRYRAASSPVERQQIKWVVFFAAVFGLFWIADPFINDGLQLSGTAYALTLLPTRYLLGALLGASFGISILRYRLWDIDVIIRRTLIYGALTSALTAIYLATVLLFQRLLPSGSQAGIVTSTLLIAALFSPLRRRIQSGIDRHFYRRKYDAEKILAAFSADLREQVNLDQLAPRLVEVVEEALQPEYVSLWLRPPTPRGPSV